MCPNYFDEFPVAFKICEEMANLSNAELVVPITAQYQTMRSMLIMTFQKSIIVNTIVNIIYNPFFFHS